MTVGKWIGVISFAVSLYILWQIKQVLLLAFAAIVLATAINRLVKKLQKQGIQRGIAVLVSVIFIGLTFAGCIAIVVPSVIQQWQELMARIPLGIEQLESWYNSIQKFLPGNFFNDIQQPQSIIQRLYSSSFNLANNFFGFFSNSVGTVLNLILVIAVTIMFLSDPTPYRKNFILLFPSYYRPRIDQILSQCEENIVGCLLGLLFNMVFIAILSGIGLWILGVKLALVNAILAGLLTFIPNLGPTLSVIPPALLALLDAPWKAIGVIILYIVIQQVESNILTPLVMKSQVSLLPAITLLSQVIFTIFFGSLGLVLAIPLVAVIQVWLQELLIEDIMNQYK